ncbi:MAG: hypothetical protein Q8K32_31245 [Archangium sp.]|nr:hypothetical protein [Archangium sp.]
MRPSDVVLRLPPLTGTFGRAEVEHTAALLIFCCWQLGDAWQPIGIEHIEGLMKQALSHTLPAPLGEPWLRSFMTNPFIITSPGSLLQHPEWFTAHGVGEETLFGFTELGLEHLRTWVPQ